MSLENEVDNVYNKIKNEINKLYDSNVSHKQIYLHFISYYEILDFIIYLLQNDNEDVLMKINWIGTDSNYINFNKYLEDYYSKKLGENFKFCQIFSYLSEVNFVCLVNDYISNGFNNNIIEIIGDNPFVLQLYDTFNLLANSFIKSKSTNVNKLKILIKEDSKNTNGFTGNLEIDNSGSRIYGKYILKKAYYNNYIFSWKKVIITN